MPLYVEIAVNVPQVSGVFHYHLPPELEKRVKVGQLVRVPFGRRTVQGVVMGFVEKPEVIKTKAVIDLIDPYAVLTTVQLEFARELAQFTLSSLAACIGLMLPPGLSQQADIIYKPQIREYYGKLSKTQKRLLSLLHKRGPLRGQQIDRSLSRMNWRSAAQALIKKGLISTESILLPPKVKPKYVRTAQLACPPEVAEKAMPTLGRKIRTAKLASSPESAFEKMDQLARAGSKALTRRQAMLNILIQRPGEIETSTLFKLSNGNSSDLQKLVDLNLVKIGEINSPALERRQTILRYLMREPEPVNVTWLYAESGGNLADLYALAEQGLIILGESEVWRDPVDQLDFQLSVPPPLTQDQMEAWQTIKAILRQSAQGEPTAPILLHGVTGSGKTEIYLHAVQETLALGKRAIVLVPEIALTPQTIRRFAGRFPGQVGLLHSGLSQGERYDTWRRARADELSVVVGPRSALFTPFNNLGLIVVDECHDDTYYQSDPEPRYHARDAAIAYARLAGAVCLLGSATPDVVSYYRSRKQPKTALSYQRYNYHSLPSRILAHREAVEAQMERIRTKSTGDETPTSRYQLLEGQVEMQELPPVEVVDMREELKSGNRSIFSKSRYTALQQVLNAKQQAILFINRRGAATYVFCRDCGYTLKCPQCDVPLTYHSQENRLMCHYCGYTRKMPQTCPHCGSQRIRQYGTGTEKVEAEVQTQFPGIRTLRWDYDTTRRKGAHDLILSHFSAYRADVLIGTQMLAKGLDLPLVTLVGVILADVGLNLPDYRAAERTFQILTQVSGRAGRSPLGGKVILQTFQPDHYVIQAASQHDYEAFYQREIAYRRQLGYPPFLNLVRLEYRDLNPQRAEDIAKSMGKKIKTWIKEEGKRATSMIGPVPCFFSRQKGYYRWQIVLRGPDPKALLRGRNLTKWKLSVNPPNLL